MPPMDKELEAFKDALAKAQTPEESNDVLRRFFPLPPGSPPSTGLSTERAELLSGTTGPPTTSPPST